MKKRDISHWQKNEYTSGLLLFAEALEEGTFHYSYESYKMPALNSHYLCYDVIQTAKDIERKVLMDGNFIPLSEEFEQTLREDIFIKHSIDDKGTLLYVKDKNSDYYDLSTSDLKAKINRYHEIAFFVKDVCETKSTYLNSLLNLIVNSIFFEKYSYKNSLAIYTMTRMLISDLVNSGYSKEYLYSTVIDYFFKPQNQVLCNEDTVVGFFNRFTFDEYEYQIIFGINKKASFMFNKLNSITVRKPTAHEKQLLNFQRIDDSVALIEVSAIDVNSAFIEAVDNINTVLALHRVNQHESKLFITPKAIVSKRKDDNTYDSGVLINSSINPMKKKGNSTDLHALFNDITLMNNINPPSSFYRAIALHNGAIESKDISNQLLNLWTIIEVLISTKRDNEDKINTICVILCAILNRCYMYSCIEQLLQDVKECTECDIDSVISKVFVNEEELDSIEKFALLLSLEKYNELRLEVLSSIEEYPLLIYRIQMYSEHIFSGSQSIYEYLHRHSKRVQWHIMRIYRNRNMIVHSGSYMPYRDMLVENLHFYVDVLIDTLIEYYHIGLLNHSSIYRNILSAEANYYVTLGMPVNKKEKPSNIQLTEENALLFIFNGYSGNTIKKAIDRVVMERRKPENTKPNPPLSEEKSIIKDASN